MLSSWFKSYSTDRRLYDFQAWKVQIHVRKPVYTTASLILKLKRFVWARVFEAPLPPVSFCSDWPVCGGLPVGWTMLQQQPEHPAASWVSLWTDRNIARVLLPPAASLLCWVHFRLTSAQTLELALAVSGSVAASQPVGRTAYKQMASYGFRFSILSPKPDGQTEMWEFHYQPTCKLWVSDYM